MKEGFKLVDSLRINSDLANVSEVEVLIDKVCNDVGVHEDVYGNVLIAVTEAVNNAVLHGNNSNIRLHVAVDVYDAPVRFCFNVADEGKGFDFLNLPDPTSPENLELENGRGIFLMRNLADEVVFNDRGNEVCIYFNKGD